MSQQRRPQEQFLAVYDEFSDSVLRHCTFRISDPERAKDLTQETFMKVWEYVAQGNEVRNMKALVFHVLRNLIIDEYRGRKKKSFSLDALKEDGFDPPSKGDNHHLAACTLDSCVKCGSLSEVLTKFYEYRNIVFSE